MGTFTSTDRAEALRTRPGLRGCRGALVTLLSFLTDAVNSVGSRIAVAYLGGFLLAIGPFDHVIVTVLNVFLILAGAQVGFGALAVIAAVVTAGNLVGGAGLDVAQAKGARESSA